MSRRTAILLALAAAFAGALPSAASASTVGFANSFLTFTAGGGETNNVTVSDSGNTYTITDPGAPIVPGPSCVAVNANQVACTSPSIIAIRVNVADGNDQVRFDGSVDLPSVFFASAILEGGDGNDLLTGAPNEANQLSGDSFAGAAPGDDVLTGGARGDSLVPGPGTDQASGGAGQDSFSVSDPDGVDVYNGGPDFDFIGIGTTRPQNISLDGQANDGRGCPGAGCEGDNYGTDIEGVFTGPADDVVTGSPSPNQIGTSAGDDQVFGGGGADFIFGGTGRDRAVGGAGPDQLSGDDGEDQLLGGAGDDELFSFSLDDEPDVLSGGKGIDLANYSGAGGPIRVDLDNRADDGVEIENDNVRTDIEDVTGSRYDDVLVGTAGANELTGGTGDDRIFGRAGLDALLGERGDDILALGAGTDLGDGGPGADRFRSRDKSRDQLRCGSSVDRVKADRRDRTTADCDKVSRR